MALFSNHWVKIFEHPYRELPLGEEAEESMFTLSSEEEADAESVSDAEDESEAAGVSQRGKVLSRMIAYISNASKLGKGLKTGELRKKMKEPAWTVPEPFNLTSFEMDGFSMKMLSSKENIVKVPHPKRPGKER